MRRLIRMLDDEDAQLGPQPGIGDIAQLVDDVNAAGVPVDYAASELPDVPPGLGLAVYRLVQEAVTNIIKHVDAPHGARVALGRSGDFLTVDVTNEGRPTNRNGASGRGIYGMRERVALYGGSLDLGPRPEGGFGVHARFPLRDATT